MNISTTNRAVITAMHRALESICGGDWTAVRVACVPNGIDYRFVASIDERWRTDVYEYLAARTDILIPADAGPLNLSTEQAVALGQMTQDAAPGESAGKAKAKRVRESAGTPAL